MNQEIVIMGYVFYQNRLLLVKHKKSGTFMSCGGHLKDNESFIDCLKREIREETGLEISVLSAYKNELSEPLPLTVNSKIIDNKKVLIFEYLCKTDDIGCLRIKKDELIDHIWLSENEIEEHVLRPIVKQIAKKAFDVMKTNQSI